MCTSKHAGQTKWFWPCRPHLDHGHDMARVQQVDHRLGGELEADLHSKSHAEGDQQQVLAQTVLLHPNAVLPHHFELFGQVDLLEGHADLQQGDEHDDQAFTEALLGRDESGALGAPVALKLGVHPAVDPVQQAVYVVSGHIPLLVLEKIRTRRNKRRHTDFLAKHELQDFPFVARLVVQGCSCICAPPCWSWSRSWMWVTLPHPQADEELQQAAGGSCDRDD